MLRLLCSFFCCSVVLVSFVGCGGSSAPTVTAPPTTPVVVENNPTVTKGYDGTVKPPTQEEIDSHNADGAGN